MSILNRLKLAHKLALMVLFPVVVMTGFASVQSISAFSLRQTAVQLQTMTELGIHSSNLVHELQKERGMTAGFIGSKGTNFGPQLKEQRRLTGEKLELLQQFVDASDMEAMGKTIRDGIQAALERLRMIDQKRSAIDALGLPLDEALSYYTGTNAAFLGLIPEMSKVSPDGDLAVMTAAYANYLQSKERAGIERAVLSGVFARDSFGPMFNKFLSLVTTQKNYTDAFLALAPERVKDHYQATLKGEFIAETERMRQVAEDKAATGGFGIDPQYWFKMQTGKINLLKDVEEFIAGDLGEKASALKAKATTDLTVTLAISLIGLLVATSMGIVIGRGIHAQMGGEPGFIEQIAKNIADGKLDLAVQDDGKAKTGVYAAMLTMQRRLSDVIEKDIQSIIDSARAGDLKQRIDLTGKSGFFKNLSVGINELVGVVENVFNDIAHTMSYMAKGDLTHPIESEYLGAFDAVKQDINGTLDNLAQTVHQMRDSADLILSAANEISSGNNNLSARTEQQASALEETASSMEELTSAVKNNADNARRANQVTSQARDMAERSGTVVGNAIEAMDGINASSAKIAQIIGVIDEIAFQTNLLALNASVEAARAGEQGRGFAVVASEVRNLAGRSATAAKEIKDLIQDSVVKIKGGSDLVNESGDALKQIVVGVKELGDIISEIAAASQEQSAGIDQVNRAVTNMDEVTQQNAALAEQTSAASASMTEKAHAMNDLMSFFNVRRDTA